MIPTGPKSTWEEQARSIIRRGYPEAAELVPDLVAWLQDLNWPGATLMGEFLVSIGAPVVPHLRPVLSLSNDRMWQYWIISEVVANLDPNLVAKLSPELKLLAALNDDEGVGEAAREVVERFGL